MLYVFVDIPASLVHHQTPFLTRLKSCPVGQGIPGFDAYSALLLRHVGQTPRRGIPCRCGQTTPPRPAKGAGICRRSTCNESR
jgi:hypothetical protein